MDKILIGFIGDGKAGGVDKYILDLYEKIHGKYADADLLTSDYTEELAEGLKARGSKLLTCPRMVNPSGQYNTLKNLVSQNGYGTVYFNYSTAIGWAALKGARDGGAQRIILHSHNSGFTDNSRSKELIFRMLHCLAVPVIRRYTTNFLACSDKAAIWMFGKKNVKIKYIKNEVSDGIYFPSDEKREFFRCKYGLTDSFVIGHVGGMLKAKNQSFLIKLMPELKQSIPNAKLMLVGDGENRQKYEELAKTLGVSDDVVFTGYLNTEDGIMNAFDIFCLPSVIEGYPYVSIEAQNLLIPCILSESVTEQIVHTNACVFVSVKKPKLWIEQIMKYKNMDKQNINFVVNDSDECFMTSLDFVKSIFG